MGEVQNLEKIGEELQKRGQAEKLKTLADSADGKKLSGMVDRRALAEAAKKGDAEALRAMMSRLLQTAEGQRLSEQVQKLLQENSRG